MSGSEPIPLTPTARSFFRGWYLVLWVVLGLAALQLVDPYITYAVLALGLAVKQVNFLARLPGFLQEMGTFYTPLAIAVAMILLTAKSWRERAKYEPAVKLLLVVAISAGVCELLKYGLGKERMKERVAERMKLEAGNLAAPMSSESDSTSGNQQIIKNIKEHGVPAVRFIPGYQLWGPKKSYPNDLSPRTSAPSAVNSQADYREARGFTSMPSSHTLSAFACFLMLARFAPALTPLCWVLAVGCGLSRIWAMDHYFSDVLAGALLAIGMIRLLERPLKLKP